MMIFSSALTEAGDSPVLYENGAWVSGDDLIAAGLAVATDLATARALVCRSASVGTVMAAAVAAERLGVNVTFVDPRLELPSVGIEVNDAPSALAPGISAERLAPGLAVPGLFERTGYSFLSSGSTAAPTRVIRPADVTVADSRQIAHAVYAESGDVVLATPCFHSYGFSHLAAAVVSGRRIHAVRPNATTSKLSAAVTAGGVRVFVGLPLHLDLILGSRGEGVFATLRTIVSSAGRLGPETAERSLAAGLPLYNAYGSTETGTLAIGDVRTVTDPVGYVGPPLPGVKVRLSGDSCSGHRVLEIRTSALAPGIIRDNHYVTTPALDGWYRTGDLARVSGQGIWLLGRQAEFLKVSGIRVSCPRVREIVLKHPSVTDVEVFGVEDRIRGEVPACRLVVNRDLRLEELQNWCRDLLMAEEIPRVMEVVDHIRRSATGKALHER
jgi:acyl-coenzyme A synthetase/AMP-(fatty) acid ligase